MSASSLATAPISPRICVNDGEVLSPSQVRTFMDCQARWYFKYRQHLPDPLTSNLALGKAVHAALAENFRQKMETREDLPTLEVVALYRLAWNEQKQQTEFADDEDVDEIGRCGEALVARYMEQLAPFIQPQAVELFVAGEIGGIRIQGIVDLIDQNRRIIDLKTRSRRPGRASFSDVFQISTYRQLLPATADSAFIDSLVKTKSVQIVRHLVELTAEALQTTTTLYPLTHEAMQNKVFMPNRLSLSCSRRHCAFWRECEREFGGRISET